jgi:hypothetical protein
MKPGRWIVLCRTMLWVKHSKTLGTEPESTAVCIGIGPICVDAGGMVDSHSKYSIKKGLHFVCELPAFAGRAE